MIMDAVLLTFLLKPAFKTKALLSGVRPRSHSFAAFNILFAFLVGKLALLIVVIGVAM